MLEQSRSPPKRAPALVHMRSATRTVSLKRIAATSIFTVIVIRGFMMKPSDHAGAIRKVAFNVPSNK